MSGFWEKALGGTQQAAPRTVPVPQVSTQPWWQQGYVPQTQPVEDPFTPQPAPVPTKATSARHTDTCPNCGSGNYAKGDAAGSMTRCFECGFNPRFDQMAFAAQGGQATTATRQAASTQTGFHGNISNASQAVGRV